MDNATLEALLVKVARRDRDAFAHVYQATAPRIFGVLRAICADDARAEVVLQETYVHLWHLAARYMPGAISPMAWLVTVARNVALAGQGAYAPRAERLASRRLRTEDATEARAASSRVAAALADMAVNYRDGLRAAYLEGAQYATLAHAANLPVKTYRPKFHRALLRFQNAVAPEQPTSPDPKKAEHDSRLAAEYALGLMEPADVPAFDIRLNKEAVLRLALARWQTDFSRMTDDIPDAAPPKEAEAELMAALDSAVPPKPLSLWGVVGGLLITAALLFSFGRFIFGAF